MAASRPSGSSLLEKWLEDLPSSNSKSTTSVKKEKGNDYQDIFSSPSFSFNSPFPSSSLPSRTATCTSQPTPKPAIVPEPPKVEENQLDSSSINGIFGWEIVNDLALPTLFRPGEKLVPVRVVEAKIIEKYSNILPWTVFSCINIKSYYVTENEAKLLNTINSSHCDYHFGNDQFTVKDVVVCLHDVFKLQKFLENSKTVFQLGIVKAQIDWLGFVQISENYVVPYIGKKSSTSSSLRKFVPSSLVQTHALLVKVEKSEMSEWDASYLKMLLIYLGLEHILLPATDELCLLSDLKWDHTLNPLHIEEYNPHSLSDSTSSKPGPVVVKQEYQSHPSHTSATVSNLTNYKQPRPVVQNLIEDPNWMYTGSVTSPTPQQAHVHKSHALNEPNPSRNVLPKNLLEDPSWFLYGNNALSPNPALAALHQITRVEVGGISLNAINLKPYSSQQAVFVGDLVHKMFRGTAVLTVHYILEKILQVKLYECSRLHEDTFNRAGKRPLQGDKLVLVETLRKCVGQLRHIIMASYGEANPLGSHYLHA
ncbi:hypothetical protein HDE_02983 [Halotydeus destructor]|nr:hypothetical protein HDE_02983 [Halotydeus destructor]